MKKVELYTKGFCPYCRSAKSLLKAKDVAYIEYPIKFKPKRRREMIARAQGRSTVPQIFIDGQHIGGSDELVALERAGQLDALLV